MATNLAANLAMTTKIGVATGSGGVTTSRTHALGETATDLNGNVWIYGTNSSGSSLAAGQISATAAGAFATGNGAIIDKAVANGSYYWARLLEGGIGLESDVAPTITFASGAANVCTVTITWKDRGGTTVKGVRDFSVFLSDSAAGSGLTASSISGELVATTGASLSTVTSHKIWSAQAAATGIFVGSLTDTAKTQGLYICVRDPQTGLVTVSATATVTASYG